MKMITDKGCARKKFPFLNIRDVFCTLGPFRVFFAIFGLGYGVQREYRKKWEWYRYAGLMLLVLWVTFYAYSFYSNVKFNYFATLTSSAICNCGRRLMVFMGIIITSVSIAFNYCMRNTSRRFFKRIQNFDKELADLGFSNDLYHEFVINFSFAVIVFASSLVCIILCAVYFDQCETYELCFYRYYGMYSVIFIYVLSISKFALLLMTTRLRLVRLNRCLSEFLDQKLEFHSLKPVKTIRKFAFLQDSLVDAVQDIIECYGVQLVFILGGVFIVLIMTLFSIVRAWLVEDGIWNLTGSFLLWSLIFVLPIIYTIAVASSLAENGKWTASIVHKAIASIVDEDMRYELIVLSQQLLHRTPTFHCYLFNYNWTLVYAIAGSITTYLMILVQFDSGYPNYKI